MPVPPELKGAVDKKKVLIVDDDKNMVSAIKRMLRLENKYDVDAAYDGFDAGRKFIEFLPDLVLLDIKMPGIDGYEVIRRLRQIPQESHIKVIAISAFFETEGKKKIMAMGADACMDKPFDHKHLIGQIENLIG